MRMCISSQRVVRSASLLLILRTMRRSAEDKKQGRMAKMRAHYAPYTRDSLTENGIKCHVCDAHCKGWSQLVRHLRRQHRILKSDLADTDLYAEMRRSTMKIMTITDEERNAVRPTDDETKFACALCDTGAIVSKRRAFAHFRKCHMEYIDEAPLKQWVVCYDGHCIRNGTEYMMQLTTAISPTEVFPHIDVHDPSKSIRNSFCVLRSRPITL